MDAAFMSFQRNIGLARGMDAAFMSFQRNIGLARGMDAAFMSFQRKVGLAFVDHETAAIVAGLDSWCSCVP
jgi:hypothetical protein